jgi:hypothetical protein
MTTADRWLVVAGLGSWLLAGLSLWFLGWSFYSAWEVPTSISNWLLIAALILGIAATIMLITRIAKLGLLSLPLLAGFAGATLVTAFALLAALKVAH